MNNQDEPFLKRWSRRKIESKDPADAVEPAPDAAEAADREPGDAVSRPDAEPRSHPASGKQDPQRPLTEADFADVDFDALDVKSDYSRFLARGVPESIKNRALRKLWASDAIFTTPDPFQDYLGDYTDAAVAVPMGTLKTAYRIGKGFLTDEEVAEWEKLGKPVEEKVAANLAEGAGGPVAVLPEPPDQPDVHALLRQSDAYMAGLYPAASNHLMDVATLVASGAKVFVARQGNTAIGCGALITAADGEAEIKRMFVGPDARGRKVGRQILLALEEAAKAAGVRVIRLEMGVRQPEALQLYQSAGYAERGPFGAYQKDPLSRFLEKWIA